MGNLNSLYHGKVAPGMKVFSNEHIFKYEQGIFFSL
jgi:hypothetical protein